MGCLPHLKERTNKRNRFPFDNWFCFKEPPSRLCRLRKLFSTSVAGNNGIVSIGRADRSQMVLGTLLDGFPGQICEHRGIRITLIRSTLHVGICTSWPESRCPVLMTS